MKPAIDVLIVEDNPTDVLLTEEFLSDSHFHAQSNSRLEDALKTLMAKHFDVILLDLGLPDSQGLDTLRTLRVKTQVAVIVLTGKNDEELALIALKEGAQDYLVKGQIEAGSLQRAIRYAVERSGSERMLRKSEERVKELTAHIHQVLWMIDAKEAKILYVSPGYEQMWGRSCQDLLDGTHPHLEGIHPLDQEMMVRENASMIRTGHIDVETRVLRPNGSVRWVWIRGYPVLEYGQIVRLVGVIEDITEKRSLAAERDALLARLQLYIERMPLAYIQFDADMRIIDWNPTAERIFGYSKEEMLGAIPPYEKFVPSSCWEKGEEIRNRIRSGEMEAHSINENVTKDGRTITCHWFNTPLMDDNGLFTGFLCLAQDVTEQKSLAAQFQQAQKMEAVGQLAGGVAHDFNNLLTVISGYSEVLLSRLPATDPASGLLQEIHKAGERAAGLTRQLLAFSRKQIIQPKVLDLNALATDVGKMLRHLIGEDVSLTTVLAPRLGRVKADPGQIEQILMNLAVNARDAMPQGGKLTIETANAELDRSNAKKRPEVQPGNYVLLAVSDTGCGMTKAVKVRLFEPFFTTKEPGKGTGLGLATVYGIVKQSGGFIYVYSEPGHGTTFKIYLPQVENGVPSDKTTHVPKPMPKGNEMILVVEDEDAVRSLTSYTLRMQGYAVLEARDGEAALRVTEQHPSKIHLLLTDVVMPRMGGRQLAERLAQTHPNIKVLYLSGYTDDAVVRHGVLEAEVAFLQKPFTPSALAQKVRDVLDK